MRTVASALTAGLLVMAPAAAWAHSEGAPHTHPHGAIPLAAAVLIAALAVLVAWRRSRG